MQDAQAFESQKQCSAQRGTNADSRTVLTYACQRIQKAAEHINADHSNAMVLRLPFRLFATTTRASTAMQENKKNKQCAKDALSHTKGTSPNFAANAKPQMYQYQFYKN